MKHKKILLIGLIIVLAAQLLVPVGLIIRWNSVLEEGKIYKFRTAPADPSDPFRGAYIQLQFSQNHWDILTGSRENRSRRIYVWLEEDSAGFAAIRKVTYDQPGDTADYVSAFIDHEYTDAEKRRQIRIRYSFDQYFLPAEKAERAEQRYFAAVSDSASVVYAQVRVKSGTGILESVMIDGTPLEGE